jgi:hypothetical protein
LATRYTWTSFRLQLASSAASSANAQAAEVGFPAL